jgi:segregation and condensation protein B
MDEAKKMSETKQIIEINEEETPRVVVFEEALEAVLFAAGHPITYSTLARVFQLTPAVVKDKVFDYAMKYNDPTIPRGVIMLTYKDSCQLCTKEHYLAEIRDALGIRKSGSLSTSSMEVLAIVAYNQPVTRAFVDTLRRVDSSYAMNNLLDRGLITSTGRLDVPGRPMLYGTTSDFLRCFGLNDLDSLPKTSDELMEVFEGAKAQEEAEIEAAEELMQDGEQLTLDIDNAIDRESSTESVEVTENSEEVELIESSPESTEEFVEFEDPSADDDIHDDF